MLVRQYAIGRVALREYERVASSPSVARLWRLRSGAGGPGRLAVPARWVQ